MSDSPIRLSIPNVDASDALEKSSIAKASRGYLVAASGRIDSTATTGTYYIQLWNSAIIPTDTTAFTGSSRLVAPLKIQHTNGSDSPFDVDLKGEYIVATNGIVIVASSTEFTKTLISTDWLSATVIYK